MATTNKHSTNGTRPPATQESQEQHSMTDLVRYCEARIGECAGNPWSAIEDWCYPSTVSPEVFRVDSCIDYLSRGAVLGIHFSVTCCDDEHNDCPADIESMEFEVDSLELTDIESEQLVQAWSWGNRYLTNDSESDRDLTDGMLRALLEGDETALTVINKKAISIQEEQL